MFFLLKILKLPFLHVTCFKVLVWSCLDAWLLPQKKKKKSEWPPCFLKMMQYTHYVYTATQMHCCTIQRPECVLEPFRKCLIRGFSALELQVGSWCSTPAVCVDDLFCLEIKGMLQMQCQVAQCRVRHVCARFWFLSTHSDIWVRGKLKNGSLCDF